MTSGRRADRRLTGFAAVLGVTVMATVLLFAAAPALPAASAPQRAPERGTVAAQVD